jgi:SagB-type dehydrogenase family enzyme
LEVVFMPLVLRPSFSTFMLAFLMMAFPIRSHATDPSSGTIKLPQPFSHGQISVEKTLSERRSIRYYKNLPISLANLSQLLWAAQGMSGSKGLRTAPSAGALYPLEVSVVAGNVSGLLPGTYVYKPESNELLKISGGDKRRELSGAAGGQSAITQAAAVLVISAVYERTMTKYGERGIRYVHMEAGHAAENVYLQAVSLDLGTVAIGAFDDDGVKRAANLTIREQPLYLMPVGKPQAR